MTTALSDPARRGHGVYSKPVKLVEGTVIAVHGPLVRVQIGDRTWSWPRDADSTGTVVRRGRRGSWSATGSPLK